MPDLQGCVYWLGGGVGGQWERMDPSHHDQGGRGQGQGARPGLTSLSWRPTPPTAPWPPGIQLHQEWPPWAGAASKASSWCGWNTRETDVCRCQHPSSPHRRPMTFHESTGQTEPLLQLVPQALS